MSKFDGLIGHQRDSVLQAVLARDLQTEYEIQRFLDETAAAWAARGDEAMAEKVKWTSAFALWEDSSKIRARREAEAAKEAAPDQEPEGENPFLNGSAVDQARLRNTDPAEAKRLAAAARKTGKAKIKVAI